MPAIRGQPSGQCSICGHPQRYRIELALVSGVSKRAVGSKFDVGADAAWRHLRNHVSEERRAQLIAGPLKLSELADKAAAEGLALIDYLSMVRSALLQQFLAATEASDRNGAAIVAGRLLEALRMMAQLTGEIGRAGATITNNTLVMSSPLMADLEQMLVTRLRPFPEAARSVLAGLKELSERTLQRVSATPNTRPLLLESEAPRV
jgi:hypothetical protein